jgi:hypothetical protein
MNEEIEPGETAFRQLREAPAGEAEQDQAEKRQRETEDIGHGGELSVPFLQARYAELPGSVRKARHESMCP